MQSRTFTQSSILARVRIAAIVGLLLLCASSAWAQYPWQVGDVVVCYGGGKCNVLRIVGSAPGTPNFLNALNDNLSGATNGTALNNTLHLLVTDGGAGQSNVVQYSIASINPFTGGTVPHNPTSFSGSSNANSNNAQAIAVDSAGEMFVGNAGSGSIPVASIVKLDAHGALVAGEVFTFSTDPCATTNLGSLDLSTAGDAIYLTAGDGKIRRVSLPLSTGSCTVFADFGSGVTLYGIKDVPAGALADNCPLGGCPSGEALLVVAKGFVDLDTGETESGAADPDAVNVCTNMAGGSAQSCALLLNTAAGTPSLTGPVWAASHLYGTADVGTTILDAFLHVEKVVSPGASGSDEPVWSHTGGTVRDNAVIWTDQGQKLWAATNDYALQSIVVDPSGHVQIATTAGKSAASEPSPWNDSGSTTIDGLIWTDQSQKLWQANFAYLGGAVAVDPAGHVQTVTTAGTSGPGPTPTFSDAGGTTIDGLTWSNQGPGAATPWVGGTLYGAGSTVQDTYGNLENAVTGGTSGSSAPSWNVNLNEITVDNAVTWTDGGGWLPNHPYALGNTVGDVAQHLQKVTTAGTSGPASAPTFNDGGGTTPDNAVVWADNGTWVASHVYSVGNLAGDTSHFLQNVTTAGTSGPGPTAPTFNHSLSTTVDGLQWQDQGTSTSVVARYPIGSQTGLQALALDPLVADCTANACSSLTFPNNRKLANFWLADSGSGNVFKVKFADGTFNTYDTNAATYCPSGGCGVGLNSIVIYGGEGANQPGLASLVLSSPSNDLQLANQFTATATILNNTITSTLYGAPSTSLTPISLYASLVDINSCFNDPLAGNLGCRATGATGPNHALVWKIDIPKGQRLALPTAETLNSSFGPPGVFGVDASTDVFVDEQFDDTTFVGTDPGTRTISVHSLHEVGSVSQTQAQCTYSSPLQNGSYKTNRGTLNFIFTCPGLSQTQFQHMHPTLSLVKKNPPQSPQFIPLSGTNGKGPYRYNSTGNFWTFQWNLNGAAAGTYEGTTFDSPGPGDNPSVQSFTVTFSLK